MSTTAPPTPITVRTSSESRRPTHSHMELPHRTQSMASRNATLATTPHRANSTSQTQNRPPSSSRQANLVHMARRDTEQTNFSRPPSSRRNSSTDKHHAEKAPTRTDSTKSTRRTSSRPGHSRHNSDAPLSPATNGIASENNTKVPPASSGQPRRRTTISAQTGQWALGKTIGAGSMGKVKIARNLETGEQVAIKIVPRQSTDEHRSQQDRERADHSKEVRTAREAAIVTLVSHPYICGMRDVVRTSYHWYMLCEYVNGGQMLDYIISHGRLNEKQARKFGRQIASALDYCHRNSIVHRDLKIENILISKTGDIKIIDFGLSNLFSPRSHLKTFCGSLYFAAPELLQAKQYTGPEVDVWSFGIVLYVLVCGKVPFDDQSMPQLHAKIKKGVVEYPPWLSTECKHIISRMLVTEPRNRATLREIMNHPWITKGFNGPPDNCLPAREPLQLPLDAQVIARMTGFDFGSSEYITKQLEIVIESEDYQKAVRLAARKPQGQYAEADRKRGGVFDFYQRRKSSNSKDALTTPSVEAVQLGEDPLNAFSPLISVYYLVREKQDRERIESNPGALSMPQSPGEKPLAMPDLPPPAAAHTNSATYEFAGEAPTGGRSRPRARTHGEDDITESIQKVKIHGTAPLTVNTTPLDSPPTKKEGVATGLLRRFSTRRSKEPDREKPNLQAPPSVAVSGPEASAVPPRKSFSVRKTREPPPSAYRGLEEKQTNLLAPPNQNEGPTRRLRSLGRSTSVNSGDLRRRWSLRRGASEASAPPSTAVSGSEKSLPERPLHTVDARSEDGDNRNRVASSRAKSQGHSRQETVLARRARREQPRDTREYDVPEETDAELAEAESRGGERTETIKPIYLKGLFSVSTTSNKPLSFIRADIIRVLKQLGVDYREIKGGFSCRHVPSIDLQKVVEQPASLPHRRKVSFAGLRGSGPDRDEYVEQQRMQVPATPRSGARRTGPDSMYTTNSDDSDDDNARRIVRSPRAAGETTTHVHSDLGQSMILKFEIRVVKVPFLSLHGLQFKKVDGGTWQYKKMAETILTDLRL